MKRLFVSELDTLLGRRVCDLFASTKEYDITGTVRSDEKAYLCGSKPLPPHVTSITPSYRTGNVAFKAAVLESDAIVCLMQDDMIEAEAASKMLRNEHYEVEKTLVVVSSVMTWADTIVSRKAQEKADRDAERAERIANGDDDDDVADQSEPEEEEEPIVLPESEYQGRVPHRRYQHWKELEVLVKQANSATLHTHVIFAGLQYGLGEGALGDAFKFAWHQQNVPLYTNGTNVVPMIHTQDLAQIIFKTASADEVSDQRYILAVDRGNNTLGSVLQTVASKMGNNSTTPMLESVYCSFPFADHFSIDIRMEPSSVFDIHSEDEWYAPNGFVQSFDRIAQEYREAHQLTPVRCLLLGPPRAGKTTIARQLAKEYRLPHINIGNIIRDYEGYLSQLETSLKAHRSQKKRARKQSEYEQAEAEAREAREEARAAKQRDDEDGEEEGEDVNQEDGVDDDDVSDIAFNNSGYHLLGDPEEDEDVKSRGEDEDGEDEEDDSPKFAADLEEDKEDEEDDPEDEVAAYLVEQITRAKEVLALKIRVGLKPRVEGEGEVEDEDEEDADTTAKPLPPGVKLRFVDEALAAMGKWRLQQKDCQNQGYILEGFPKNVRQAQAMFHAEEVTLPSVEEVKEREQEPLPPMDLNDSSVRVDHKLLPEVCIHLYADDALLLSRVDDSESHTCMDSFLKRLRQYKADHDPTKLADTSLVTWVRGATTEEREANSENGFVPAIAARQMFYVEVSAGGFMSEESSKVAMGYLRSTIGDRHYIHPTVQELKAEACEQRHRAEILAFQSQRAEERRLEEERLAYERHQREVAVHERRYRSIAEEKVLAQTIVDMPMESYLAQFVLQPISKGVERVVSLRPEDPVQALADFLFEYEPRTQL